MKQLLMAAPLGLAIALIAGPTSAATNSGTIFFEGEIRTGTCPIEVVDPISGGTGNSVPLGIAITGAFGGIGSEVNQRRFSMRVPDSCVAAPGDITVKFESQAGAAGASSEFYALRPSSNTAGGLAVVIKDHRDNSVIAHGAESKPYTVVSGKGVDMHFLAAYRSTAATVTQGSVNADVNFTVTLP
jgi:major type 1 subunit fimbrin (pilin)/fimbrial protein